MIPDAGFPWGVVLLSVQVAAVAVLVAFPMALAVAAVLARPSFRGKALLSALVHLPLVTPPVVTGYALLVAFGKRGPIGGFLDSIGVQLAFHWTGAALAAGVMAFPLLVRPIRIGFESIDPDLDAMAATLGAGRWRRFRTIALPLAWPGCIAGLVLGFAKALGEFGATITFVGNIPGETQTLSLAIYTLLQAPDGESAALWLIGASVAISFIAVLLSEVVTTRMERRRRS